MLLEPLHHRNSPQLMQRHRWESVLTLTASCIFVPCFEDGHPGERRYNQEWYDIRSHGKFADTMRSSHCIWAMEKLCIYFALRISKCLFSHLAPIPSLVRTTSSPNSLLVKVSLKSMGLRFTSTDWATPASLPQRWN